MVDGWRGNGAVPFGDRFLRYSSFFFFFFCIFSVFYLVGKERMPTFVPYVISERKPNVLPKKKTLV